MIINKYYNIARKNIYPLNRSITGKGTLKSLKIIKHNFKNLKIKNFKSGTKVFDWKIPYEWEIIDGYIVDKYNKKIIDFKKNNLHVVGYSHPINKKIKLKFLLKKLNSIPNQPNAIPYITSYYKNYWGFCVSENSKKEIIKNYNLYDEFKVVIKSKLKKNGKLNYGELVIKGKSKQEILISTYICHPSLANDNLSGNIVSMCLIDFFSKKNNLKTLRFLFIPETIGSISYINKNFKKLKKNVIGGFIITCIGDERQHSCLLSKYKNSLSDDSLKETYRSKKIKYKIYNFLQRGSDERQFGSPGVDIPMTSIFRTKYGKFPEYHTSLDNFELVTKKGINGGFEVAKKSIEILQKKIIPVAKNFCEPHLGKRNLFPSLSNKNSRNFIGTKFLDFLQFSDGSNDINKISKYIKLSLNKTKKIYKILKKNKLIDD